jgi:predicted protein tyrosine phosphatase/rhodanese-related sulfurtransferase
VVGAYAESGPIGNLGSSRRELPGAVRFPLSSLRRRYQELPTQRPIAAYGKVGQRAYYAVRFLAQRGYHVAKVGTRPMRRCAPRVTLRGSVDIAPGRVLSAGARQYGGGSNQRYAISKLYVTNIEDLPEVARRIRPSDLISLVPIEEQPRTPSGVNPSRHLRLLIHDITTSEDAGILPQSTHIQTLIDFIRDWKQQDGPLLLHCIAGVSRSSAAALITLVTLAPGHESEAARALRRAGPHFSPNRLMIQLADDILGTGGRLLAACEAMGPADLNGERPTEVEIPLLDP